MTWISVFARVVLNLVAILAIAHTPACAAADKIAAISVDPAVVRLTEPRARFLLLVNGKRGDGRVIDVSRAARFRSSDVKVAVVSSAGVVRAVNDGTAMVSVTVGDKTAQVQIHVSNTHVVKSLHFENDLMPILSKFGCNSGVCHGKAEGRNGFKLSVFGYDPPADRKSLMSESRGRRLLPAVPEKSLLLRKISGGVPHGGGVRIRRGSPEYQTLRDWIAAGMPLGKKDAPRLVAVRVSPQERRMDFLGEQQLRVLAVYSDGRTRDVTRHAKFQSNNDGLADVSANGLVTAAETPGDAAIMVNYAGSVDLFHALVPRPVSQERIPWPASLNFIDRLVDAKLKKLNITPSGLCNDSAYVRRVFLDLIGTLPTPGETRLFLADKRSDKRMRLVELLLKRPEFADYWAMRWSDLLRVDRQALGYKGAYGFYRWIRTSIAGNKPYDRFVSELVTAEGSLRDAPAGHFYQVVKNPGAIASTLSQVLLGIRIECAQCHHHPFDRWTQTDYFGMQAFFTQVALKNSPRGAMLTAFRQTKTRHPRTGEEIFAHPLGTKNPDSSPVGDRRRELAKWMTAPDNPWLARNFVNRVWAHLAGRGLIEPVDDVRSTNPPSNPKLLDALAKDFVKSGFDFHALIRRITASRTYQLSSQTNVTNTRDEQNHSRAMFKRLEAEVLLDAVCQVTGVSEKFHGMPAGYRAIQLWDSHVPNDFLKLFGRPTRATACECERSASPSVAQVLHILNSPRVQGKLSHAAGRIRTLVQKFPTDNARLVNELYLTFYSRFPTKSERQATVAYFQSSKSRQKAAEDISWSMMNTVEFLFNR